MKIQSLENWLPNLSRIPKNGRKEAELFLCVFFTKKNLRQFADLDPKIS
jgi:hypothetical protein